MDRPDEIGKENRLLGNSCPRTAHTGKDMQYGTRDDISYVNCASANCEMFVFRCDLIIRKFDVILYFYENMHLSIIS